MEHLDKSNLYPEFWLSVFHQHLEFSISADNVGNRIHAGVFDPEGHPTSAFISPIWCYEHGFKLKERKI